MQVSVFSAASTSLLKPSAPWATPTIQRPRAISSPSMVLMISPAYPDSSPQWTYFLDNITVLRPSKEGKLAFFLFAPAFTFFSLSTLFSAPDWFKNKAHEGNPPAKAGKPSHRKPQA